MNTIRLLLSVSITLFGQVFSAHRGCSLPSSPSLNFMIARARAPSSPERPRCSSSILSFLRTDAIRLPNALNWTPIVKAVTAKPADTSPTVFIAKLPRPALIAGSIQASPTIPAHTPAADVPATRIVRENIDMASTPDVNGAGRV